MALIVKFAGSGVQNSSVPVQPSLQVCQGLCSVPFTCSPHCPSARLQTASFAALGWSCATAGRGRDRGRLTRLLIPQLRQRSCCRTHRLKRKVCCLGSGWAPKSFFIIWLSPTTSLGGEAPLLLHTSLANPACALVWVPGAGLVGMTLLEMQGAPDPSAWGGQPPGKAFTCACQKTPPGAPALWAMQGGGWMGFTAILQARV